MHTYDGTAGAAKPNSDEIAGAAKPERKHVKSQAHSVLQTTTTLSCHQMQVGRLGLNLLTTVEMQIFPGNK